jgi:hypothetical protein
MAEHDREPWSSEEIEFLMEFFAGAKGDPVEEREVAEALGRTIEACRQRFYETRKGRCSTVSVKTTTTTTTVEYRGHFDDPDDQWWSPDYYTKGK